MSGKMSTGILDLKSRNDLEFVEGLSQGNPEEEGRKGERERREGRKKGDSAAL